ncbi:MAG: fimbrillin family protein [Bacteroidales bacterium]|nr:fimbrillin family protein [Bacteroidales bacterium]
MRKTLLYLCCLFAFLSVSCVKEEFGEDGNLSGRKMQNLQVSFNGVETKGGESDGETFLGETEYVTEDGDTLYVSVFLSDMDGYVQPVETKSSLIDNSNFGKADGYTSFNVDVYRDGESSPYVSMKNATEKETMEGVAVNFNKSESKWHFGKKYFWPTDNGDFYFCSYGPVSVFSSDERILSKSWNKDTKTFTFEYSTPDGGHKEDDDFETMLDAENQMDVVVGVNKHSYVKGEPNNINVGLQHPMMAVRFVMGDIFGKIGCISLNNFYSQGTASVTQSGVTWSGQANKKNFFQTFDAFDTTKYTDEQKASGTIPLDTTSVKRRNFIIIPQVIPEDAFMGIKMDRGLHQIQLDFDKICKDGLTRDWTGYAGKVLTFRVNSKKANLVSVDVTDDVVGKVKNNIKIFNDGKSPIYIRAVLVGNWLNMHGNILAAWDESFPYGKFDGKDPTEDDTAFPHVLGDGWVLHTDGFYYYKYILPYNYRVTHNLFEQFELTHKPKVENTSDPDVQIANFSLSILVQAVAAVSPSGESDVKYNAKRAWGIDGSFLETTEDKASPMAP